MREQPVSEFPGPHTRIQAHVDKLRPALRRYRRYVKIALPALPILVTVVAAALAPYIAPHDPNALALSSRLRPPVWLHGGKPGYFLGTDELGRDVLSRVIYGARISLPIGLTATALGGIVGIASGTSAAYFGGGVDNVITKLIDIQLAFPFVLFAIAVVAITSPNLGVLVVVLSVRSWTTYARIVRGEVLSLSERDFITAARAVGGAHRRIILKHVVPNILPAAIVVATFDVGRVIILESTLSFLGLGVQPPTVSWGDDLSDARAYMATAWWTTTFPGLALLLLVLSINLLGDGLRDILDPRLRGR